MTRLTSRSEPATLPSFTETDEWDGWKKGDQVTVAREPGLFKIVSFRLDPEDPTGTPLWVSVVGGRYSSGENAVREWRSFTVDRLTRQTPKVGGRRVRKK